MTPPSQPGVQVGTASFYDKRHAGRKTANGERFDPGRMTAAHPTLPMGSTVRVTCTDTGRTVVVRVNDRGPARWTKRVIDLSEAAAKDLGFHSAGLCRVTLDVIERGRLSEIAEAPRRRP